MSYRFLRIAGSFKNWSVYKKSVIICDVTEIFINRALPHNSRTIDQMRQAARSCKQNIVEGCTDGSVSMETCIKLLGIAKGSARELAEDYSDYLRQHKCEIWPKDDLRTISTRSYCITHTDPEEFTAKCESRSDETVANIMLTLLYQMDALLAKVLKDAEEEFLAKGGIREAMTAARLKSRNSNKK